MPIFAATIATSSFLLFLIQPILAKLILPWFGGSAAVWTTCLVFFQFVLLAGYAYADLTTSRLAPRVQMLVHVVLLAASLAVLPVLPDAEWKPLGSENPALRIVGLLMATVGLPYFLLSTTGPLVQAWFARSFAGAAPYRLFALSNFASMLALLAYPVAVEPWFSSAMQGKAWSAAYVIFVLLCVTAAIKGGNVAAQAQPVARAAQGEDHSATAAPTLRQRVGWFLLAALGSLLLLAVTNHVCANIASIPFLWVAPLSLYLLSFILCFDGHGWYRRGVVFLLTGALLIPMAGFLLSSALTLNLKLAIPLYLAGLFFCCMLCHGELAAAKPTPRYLTGFYLMVAAGGAAGALLVGVLAPQTLPGYFELGFGLVLVALLMLVQLLRAPLPYVVAALIVLAVVGYASVRQVETYSSAARVMARNFYGSLRTWDTRNAAKQRVRKFVHGAILHGQQFLDGERRDEPTTYYSATSGVGLALEAQDGDKRRVGLIGLGAGTLASYGRAGDQFRFYEINQQVIDIALSEFTFIGDSRAKVDIVLGDARLNLEREEPAQFDLLVVDAFSGDAIPVHLITREAIVAYLRHLRPGGVIAFHVTNRYLELAPVVDAIARERGLSAVLISDDPPGEDTDTYSRTDWVLVSADQTFFARDSIKPRAEAIARRDGLVAWTDDYNNLWQILK